MALREIRTDLDPILRKVSREVTEINDRILTLLDDMVETMNHADGVGLAAPQVGILRRAVVIDVGEGPLKLLNPEILEEEGDILAIEGCLSVPGRQGTVHRPQKVKIKYMDTDGKNQVLEGCDLLARAICHEIDHLNGILYTDIMVEEIELNDEEV